MTVFAYLRVSTDTQDILSQKHGILEYCNDFNLGSASYVEDSVSGTVSWRKRKLGYLVTEHASEGDTLVFAEVSRIGRSTLDVLEVLKVAAERGLTVHIAKQNLVMDGSMQAQIMAVMLGLAAEIERSFTAQRTKEGLAKRKAEIDANGYFINKSGHKVTRLGRPRGRSSSCKLDQRRAEIDSLLAKGVSKRSIAKIVDCSRSTLYDWLDRNNIQ